MRAFDVEFISEVSLLTILVGQGINVGPLDCASCLFDSCMLCRAGPIYTLGWAHYYICWAGPIYIFCVRPIICGVGLIYMMGLGLYELGPFTYMLGWAIYMVSSILGKLTKLCAYGFVI